MRPTDLVRSLAVLAWIAWIWLPACSEPRAGSWYQGDLHAHSSHSDGDSSVAEVLSAAELRGLDFFALTDHDTDMAGIPRHWDDPDYRSERMILLYGIEWTTGKGHANLWSVRPFPYDRLWLANRAQDAESAARIAHGEGALFSINHPRSDRCCPWEYEVPALADCVEIWNAPYKFPNKNHKAVGVFYRDLLLSGRRLSAVGGSDSHSLHGFQARVNQPGNPTTWVYATERSASGILEGIRAGRTSVSYSPLGDRLDITADADGDGEYELMGGDVAPADRSLTIKVQIHGPNRLEEGVFRQRASWCLIYRGGKVVKRSILKGTGDAVTFVDTPSAGTFYRAELRGNPRVGLLQRLIYCRTLALTNPLYVR